MSKRSYADRVFAILDIVDRARQGDKRVLRIAREKAEEGNRFAKDMLEKVEAEKHANQDR